MTTLLDVIRGQAPLPAAPPERAQPIDTAEANELRYQLLLWGGGHINTTTGAWPTLHAVGLGATGADWTAWLERATVADLQRALAVAAEIDASRVDVRTGEILEVGVL